jgi:hydrogenase expression/formation protein HypD
MKYLEEFRDIDLAKRVSDNIKRVASKPWKIMEVCGGQTHTILQYGLPDLLPSEIELLHGPGCPVCVTPLEIIDKAIAIAKLPNVIFCSYGDMLRVPGSASDLLEARANGADVRTVYSPLDAVQIAAKNPDKRVAFFAIGFETTAPANAMSAYQARRMNLNNFFLLCSHVTVPPVMAALLEAPDNQVQAFIGPGHVCCVMGSEEYEALSSVYKVPIVISGFEPLDILEAVYRCVLQLEAGEAKLHNQYSRVVNAAGNKFALDVLSEVFEISDRTWRGLGAIPKSGFKLSAAYKQYDAELQFEVESIRTDESPLCISGLILRGVKKPFDCSAFGKQCTPEHPLGATMVSSEGTCSNYYRYGRLDS